MEVNTVCIECLLPGPRYIERCWGCFWIINRTYKQKCVLRKIEHEYFVPQCTYQCAIEHNCPINIQDRDHEQKQNVSAP